MQSLAVLVEDEQNIINHLSPSAASKIGQVYCYLSSGPVPLIKIGKGKNGRQRMASWLKDYPPSWKEGEVIFVIDKMNQSTAETALHRFFSEERVSKELMRKYLGLQEWQALPDGSTEWFHCSRNVKDQFRSIGIDLVQIYKSRAHRDMAGVPEPMGNFELNVRVALCLLNRAFRTVLGWTTLLITTIITVSIWGSWIPIAITVFLGLYLTSIFLPNKH